MKKKLSWISVSMVLSVSLLAGCGAKTATNPTSSQGPAATNAPAASAKPQSTAATKGSGTPLVVKVATGTAPEHPENLGANKFKEILEKDSNGQIKVEVYPNGQLGSQANFVDNLRSGTLDVTMVTPGFFAKYAQILNVYELPYLLHTPEQAKKFLAGPGADRLRKLVDAQGVHLLAFWDAGLRETTNNKRPINTPDDLKGLKIRVPESKVNLDTWKAFGANAAPLAFTEVYMALKQGVFDGQENPPANIYNSKLYEAQKYLSLTNHLQMVHLFMYSGKLWDQLSPENQKLITNAAVKAGEYQWDVTQKQDSDLIEKLKTAGMKVNDVNVQAFQDKVKPLFDQYIKDYGDEAKQIISEIQAAEK